MSPEDKKIAVSAFVNSLYGKIILSNAAGTVQPHEAFNLELALEASFDAVEKHKYERGIMTAEKRDNIVIFDP
jgi:hypothetical protein